MLPPLPAWFTDAYLRPDSPYEIPPFEADAIDMLADDTYEAPIVNLTLLLDLRVMPNASTCPQRQRGLEAAMLAFARRDPRLCALPGPRAQRVRARP